MCVCVFVSLPSVLYFFLLSIENRIKNFRSIFLLFFWLMRLVFSSFGTLQANFSKKCTIRWKKFSFILPNVFGLIMMHWMYQGNFPPDTIRYYRFKWFVPGKHRDLTINTANIIFTLLPHLIGHHIPHKHQSVSIIIYGVQQHKKSGFHKSPLVANLYVILLFVFFSIRFEVKH